MTIATKREKLHDLINAIGDERIDAIFSLFEDQLSEPYIWWEDIEFVAELEQRVKDFETGKDKGVTWEDIKEKIRLDRQSK